MLALSDMIINFGRDTLRSTSHATQESMLWMFQQGAMSYSLSVRERFLWVRVFFVKHAYLYLISEMRLLRSRIRVTRLERGKPYRACKPDTCL